MSESSMRTFIPTNWGINPISPGWYDTDTELSYMTRRRATLFIRVDGACRNNGRSTARASTGIFFGPGSFNNISAALCPDHGHPQTNQYAELFAVFQALRKFKRHQNREGWSTARNIVIVTDSAYVWSSLTNHVFGWKANGYINSKRRPVVHGWMFQRVERIIKHLEEDDITVMFWKVDRSMNSDADSLAKKAL